MPNIVPRNKSRHLLVKLSPTGTDRGIGTTAEWWDEPLTYRGQDEGKHLNGIVQALKTVKRRDCT